MNKKLLVAVGSRHDEICSVGAFARAEAQALRGSFSDVQILEPTIDHRYPFAKNVVESPDIILFHAPALHDRIRPWNALKSALTLRYSFPRAKFISIVHEFSEAPTHWKFRQLAIARLSHAVVVNSVADEQGLKPWHSKILRVPLGPTLFLENLPETDDVLSDSWLGDVVRKFRTQAMEALNVTSDTTKLVVHPGLVTPGKGVNSLERLIPVFESAGSFHLVVMGGTGPKARDKIFAAQTTATLQQITKGRFTHLNSPKDELFKIFLTAADLVVLPYDEGVSERRSSFLSSMWNAANLWITTGRFSSPLDLANSAVHSVTSDQFLQGHPRVRDSIVAALAEPSADVLQRRLRNLKWAYGRSWKNRSQRISDFSHNLF